MRAVGTASLWAFAAGQQAGDNNENYLMPMTLQSCRWSSQGRKECTEEPKSETCARNCAAGAVDQETWEGTYGVKQNGNGGDVGFVTRGPNSVNVGPRSYLMEDDKEYKLFNMLQKEISFVVALSNMPCGTNAAIYFSEMEKTGNMGETNKAGAPYGTGYCDGQCARSAEDQATWAAGGTRQLRLQAALQALE